MWCPRVQVSILSRQHGVCCLYMTLLFFSLEVKREVSYVQSTQPHVTCCRVDSIIWSPDPVVCLVGTLAEYIHHRHVVLSMPAESQVSESWLSPKTLHCREVKGRHFCTGLMSCNAAPFLCCLTLKV